MLSVQNSELIQFRQDEYYELIYLSHGALKFIHLYQKDSNFMIVNIFCCSAGNN